LSKHQPIPEPTPLRSVLTVAIFLAGFIAAVVGYLQVQPAPRAGLPSAAPGFLATVEPAAAQAVIQDMIKGDARDLATRVKSADLTDLQTAVNPLVDITSIDFVSASRLGNEELAAYLAIGKTSQGQKLVRGFFLRVQNGAVVGIN